ncbi:protein-disulfide reductase DsbD [Halomonas beimenensis]|uniref:Cytochrome c-type biogenesis protein DsbD, protein-disulfide reductase n=1 Tax=Halomonas beimenensis TaxID=475662 RepID=A0A291P8L5_9GAMM|nr:protein-disulfide reductase DsbD [Halomonas beimenensis]ATJ83207.1 cytochrome c-type biogenesis protein DsbD, protein-disulfide reductase [Halomonas beimenensis]
MSYARRLLSLLAFLLFPLAAQAQWFGDDQADFLPVQEAFQPSAWHDGETLMVGFENAEGYYLYRHRFNVEADDIALGEPRLPAGEAKTDEFLGDVRVFYDRVVFAVPLEGEASGPLALTLGFQGCADAGLCYPPERVTLVAPQGSPPAAFAGWADASGAIGAEGASPRPGLAAPVSEDGRFSTLIREAELPVVLGLFLLAGLGLTFTPCVLPMVPILSSIIVGQRPGRPRALLLSASYVAGMVATYTAVGVLMGLFGAGLNLQARLQSAPVLIAFAALFVLFALAMFGAVDLRLTPRLAGRIDAWQARAQQAGPAGLALAGALSVLVVSPCVSAPLAGALVFISSTGDALMGGAALLALSLGMGLPLLLVGTLGPGLLPRTGAWMTGVKTAFGFLLLGIGVWLIERLVPAPLALLLWATLAIGAALALGALTWNTPRGWPRVRQTAGLLLLTWGVTLVIGASRGAHDPLRPLAASPSPASTGAEAPVRDIRVVRTLPELETALSDGSGPAFVNVTADWCISCKVMEREVFPDPAVAAPLADFRRIEVDVTETDAGSRALLEHYALFGPPSLLFFDGGRELRDARIQGEVDADRLAGHLEGVKAWLGERQG